MTCPTRPLTLTASDGNGLQPQLSSLLGGTAAHQQQAYWALPAQQTEVVCRDLPRLWQAYWAQPMCQAYWAAIVASA